MIKSKFLLVTGLDGNPVRASFHFHSQNSKTGNMVQIYFLPEKFSNKERPDTSDVCGACPMSERGDKSCYVLKGFHSRMALDYTMRVKGQLESVDEILHDLRYRGVRFGAFGDPVLLGEENIKKITEACFNWTGYTRQWMNEEYQWARKYFMASVHNEDERKAAKLLNWNTFLNYTDGEPTGIPCPASAEEGKRTICDRCFKCNGRKNGNKHIIIKKH